MDVRWAITIDPAAIKKIIRKYNEQVHTRKFDKLDEMDHFLEKHKPNTKTIHIISIISYKYICIYNF